MMHHVNIVILLVAYSLGFAALLAAGLYALAWLAGKILQLLGYYKMFVQVMYRMAKEGKFKKK